MPINRDHLKPPGRIIFSSPSSVISMISPPRFRGNHLITVSQVHVPKYTSTPVGSCLTSASLRPMFLHRPSSKNFRLKFKALNRVPYNLYSTNIQHDLRRPQSHHQDPFVINFQRCNEQSLYHRFPDGFKLNFYIIYKIASVMVVFKCVCND